METSELRDKLKAVLERVNHQDAKDKLLLLSKAKWLPHVVVIVATVGAIISIQIYKNSVHAQFTPVTLPEARTRKQPDQEVGYIYVDVSGAVQNPDMYKLPVNSRLDSSIKMAGGLSESADRGFFARNFNLSSIIGDQQKIHVPSILETSRSLYIERTKVVSAYSQGEKSSPNTSGEAPISRKISINNSSSLEIESLKGVGKITAERIISSRPYETLDDLVIKGILKKSLFEAIQSEIEL
ncbi:MAG: SLBB domain-containing protein [bacterium]